MSGYVLLLLTVMSFLSGTWGLYRDLGLPMTHGGVGCLCEVYLTTTCLFALPALVDSVLKLLFGCFLCLRTRKGWIASQRLLVMLMFVQVLMIPMGIGYQYRLLQQGGHPLSILVMPAIIHSMVQLFFIGLTVMIFAYLRSSKVKRQFDADPACSPVTPVPAPAL